MWDKILTKRQLEVSHDIKDNNPRHIILEGAVRSGKTILAIMYFISLLKTNTNKLFIMTGQTISSLTRNVLDEMTKLFGIDTHLNMKNEFEFNGNKIACFGTDKVDSYKSMRGLTASGWYGNEIILSHQNSILEAFARCSTSEAKIIWETNPDKPQHFVKTNYIDKSGCKFEDGSYNILSYHFELEDNTFLDRNYIESLKNAIPKGTVFDRQIKGLWKATDKAVYNNIKVVQCLPQRIDDYAYGLDFGYNNPSALVKVIWSDNNVYVQKLFQQSKLTSSQLVDKVKSYINDNKPIYCDSAEPDKIDDLCKAGLNAIKANKEVMPGIRKAQNLKEINLLDDVELVRAFENYEFQSNGKGEVIDEPIKFDDHLCIEKNTKIYTLKGIKKIKDIKINDYVLTRKGFKKVLNVFNNGKKEINIYKINNKKLEATKDHKIITKEGKKELQDLTLYDTLFIINKKDYKKCKRIIQKLLFLTGLSLKELQTQKEGQIEYIINAIQDILKKELDFYIEKYGKKKTEKYQKGVLYIIKIITLLIIKLRILNVYLKKNISKYIIQSIVKKLKIKLDKILKRIEIKQYVGINQKKEENGIKKKLKNKTLDIIEKIKYVLNVILNILQKQKIKNYVLINVNQNKEENQKLIMKKEFVNHVKKNMKQINIQNNYFVQSHVQKKEVFDIEVEDEHEYYANGILISNCDSFRYCIFSHTQIFIDNIDYEVVNFDVIGAF